MFARVVSLDKSYTVLSVIAQLTELPELPGVNAAILKFPVSKDAHVR